MKYKANLILGEIVLIFHWHSRECFCFWYVIGELRCCPLNIDLRLKKCHNLILHSLTLRNSQLSCLMSVWFWVCMISIQTVVMFDSFSCFVVKAVMMIFIWIFSLYRWRIMTLDGQCDVFIVDFMVYKKPNLDIRYSPVMEVVFSGR